MERTGPGNLIITKGKILIVEGVEDKRFFDSLLKYLDISDIQVLPIGGKTKLLRNLLTLKKDPNFILKVSKLAVTRDADNSAEGAFQSICGSLKNAGFSVPTSVLQNVGSNPVVTVIIIPPSRTQGKLEDLCLEAVSEDLAIPCVQSYFSCLRTIPDFAMPSDLSKAQIHAFLSSRIDPEKRLGEAAEAGYFPFSHTAFNTLIQLLKQF